MVTRHQAYLAVDLARVADVMRTPTIVDGRDVFDPIECKKAGFAVRAVGKG